MTRPAPRHYHPALFSKTTSANQESNQSHGSHGTDHRHHRPGRFLPGRVSARTRVTTVHGMVRRSSTENVSSGLSTLPGRIQLAPGRPARPAVAGDAAREVRPTEVYNLAAQSFVPTSWEQPIFTGEVTAVGRHANARRHPAGRCRASVSTRPAPARCSARSARRRSARRRRFIRAARTAWPRCTATTSRSTIAKATASSPARGSCSTTNRRGAAWNS